MSAPIKFTCPKIDDVIKDIKSSLMSVTVLKDTAYEYLSNDLKNEIDNAIDLLTPLSQNNSRNLLEDLRDCNSGLRGWGDNLETKLEDAQQEINDLNDKISELE